MKSQQVAKYSEAFRQEAVALVEQSKRPLEQVARDLGVSKSALSRWRQQERLMHAGTSPVRGKPESSEQEIRRLRQENQVLRMEREVLKKAITFFAKEPK